MKRRLTARALARDLAAMMDECADESGQWDGADVCDRLAEILRHQRAFSHCSEHGLFARAKGCCPYRPHVMVDGSGLGGVTS